jgi:hypothetical protein
MSAAARRQRLIIEEPPAAAMTTSAGEEAPSVDWLAAQDFEPWDTSELSAPSDEEWADLANPHAFMLRTALQLVGLTKPQLIEHARSSGPGVASVMATRLTETREFLEAWAGLAGAAEARVLSVVSVLAAAETSDSAAGVTERPASASIADLVGDWMAAKEEEAEAFARVIAAEQAAYALHPQALELIQDPRRHGQVMGRAELERLDAQDRLCGRAEGSPRVEALNLWTAQCDAIDSSFGVPGLDQAANRVSLQAQRLGQRIAASEPSTAKEAALKFGVLLSLHGDGEAGIDDPAPIRAFLQDLEHLARLERRS